MRRENRIRLPRVTRKQQRHDARSKARDDGQSCAPELRASPSVVAWQADPAPPYDIASQIVFVSVNWRKRLTFPPTMS